VPRRNEPLVSLKRISVGEREIVLVHEAASDMPHRLDEETRKLRREDNKAMKISRKRHRKRHKHGRP
jgi:hypothetical protein